MTTSDQVKRDVVPVEKPEPRKKSREAIYTYAVDVEGHTAACWLRQFSDQACAGRMDHAHLIPQQTLRKAGLSQFRGDSATWVPACRSHHFSFDAYRGVQVPRGALPEATERFAERHGLGSYLDRRYGVSEEAAA